MDALQLQRCVVACVLDGSGAILVRLGPRQGRHRGRGSCAAARLARLQP